MKLKKVRQMFAFTLALAMVTPNMVYASPVQTVIEVLEDGTQLLKDGTKILPDGTHVDANGNQIIDEVPEQEAPIQPEVDVPQTDGNVTAPEGNGGTQTPDENGGETEIPDEGTGDVEKPDENDGETEKPDGNEGGNTENPDGNTDNNNGEDTEKPDGNGDNNTENPDGNGDNNTETPDDNTENPDNNEGGNTETPDSDGGTQAPEQTPEQPETPAPEQPETPQEEPAKPNVSRPRPVIKPQMQEVKDFRFFQIGKNYCFAKEDIEILEEKADTARVIGKLAKDGMAFVIKDCKDGWIFIESGDSRGFVKSEKLAMSGEAGTIVEALKKQAQEQTDKENEEIKAKITEEVTSDSVKEKGESDEDFKKRVDAKIEELFNAQKKPLINWETLRVQAETLIQASENKNVAFSRATTKNIVIAKSFALVDATALNVREGKGTDSRIVGLLPSNALMYVMADADQEWVYIESGDVRGFVHSDYVKTGTEVDEEVATTGEDNFPKVEEYISYKDNASVYYTTNSIKGGKRNTINSAKRQEIVDYASQYIGNPYVWGGTDPVNGADCSGFVQSIYRDYGFSLPRVAEDQAYYGTQIPVEEALPGDLIFYMNSSGYIYHVAMYAGDGYTVEAMNSDNGICNGTVGAEACWATRIIEDDVVYNEEAYQIANTGDYGDYLGQFKLTYYCACPICCGEFANGITATGTTATEGRTIAVDPSVIPYGTQVIINGNVYTAEDCGGAIKGNRIDVYMNSHEAALSQGVGYADVFLKK